MENETTKELKTKDVTDKNTGLVWKSDREHNATTFNNHEVVRPTADIMAKVQLKRGVSELTVNAKKYIASLISADIGENVLYSELTAPIHQEESDTIPTIKANAPVTATATADKTGLASHYIDLFKAQMEKQQDLNNKQLKKAVEKNVPQNLQTDVYNAIKIAEVQPVAEINLFA